MAYHVLYQQNPEPSLKLMRRGFQPKLFDPAEYFGPERFQDGYAAGLEIIHCTNNIERLIDIVGFVNARNVVGWIEIDDPRLAQEVVYRALYKIAEHAGIAPRDFPTP